MAEHVGLLVVECDAPPYAIVEASSAIGIEAPEDVRWCRLSHHRERRRRWRRLWSQLTQSMADADCACGQSMPTLDCYIFTLTSGVEVSYLLGQCARCHTVYWE
jgi:hypothetical protein